MRFFSCLSISPDFPGHSATVTVTVKDLELFYGENTWYTAYTVHTDDADVWMLFNKVAPFDLRSLTVCIPAIEACSGYGPRGRSGKITFTQRFMNSQVRVSEDNPLVVEMKNWDVASPGTRFANIVPRYFVINGVRYKPVNPQGAYGTYEKLNRI